MNRQRGVSHVWLGRPWRALASVVFLNTEMGVNERDPHTKKLTAAEAAGYETKRVLGGADHFDPGAVR